MFKISIKEKKYQEKNIFNDLNISLNNGLYLLQGENGSGKTTLLKLLFRLDEEYIGEILVGGKNIKEIELAKYRTQYITYINQEFDLFKNLSPMENLSLLVRGYDVEVFQKLVEGLNLEEIMASNKKLKNFSGGQKQKVKILIGLISDTPILLMDEPDNNLDLEAVGFLASFLENENKLLIIAAHTFDEYLDAVKVKRLKIRNKSIVYMREEDTNNVIVNRVKEKLKIENKILKKLKNELRWYRFGISGVFFIFIILVLVNFMLVNNSLYDLDIYRYNMSDNAIEIFIPSSNFLVESYDNEQALEKVPYFFTSDMYDLLKAQEEIEYIQPIGLYDMRRQEKPYIVDLSFDASSLDYEKYDMEEYYFEGDFGVEVGECVEPKRVNDNGISTCGSFDEELLYGEYPEDESDQVLLDGYLAIYFAQEKGLGSLGELIGEKVSFNVEYYEEVGDEHETIPGEVEYTVSGIAKPVNIRYQERQIILPYEKNTYTDFANHPWLDRNMNIDISNEEYALYILGSSYESMNLPEPTVEDIKPLKDNAYPGFYIETKTAQDVEKLVGKIQNYDPYITIKSNYTAEHTSNFIYLKNYLVKKVSEFIIMLFLLIISMVLLTKYYKILIKKDIDKFRRFGFSSDETLKYIKVSNKALMNNLIFTLILIFIIVIIIAQYSLALMINSILFLIICFVFIKALFKINIAGRKK